MTYVPETGSTYPDDQLFREFQSISNELNLLRETLIQALPWKAVFVKVTGAGLADPPIINRYNVTSVTRLGVGLYQATVQSVTILGEPLTDSVYVTGDVAVLPINRPADTEVFIVELIDLDPVGLTFDMQVLGFHSPANAKLELVPYDILAGDDLEFWGLANLGTGEVVTDAQTQHL